MNKTIIGLTVMLLHFTLSGQYWQQTADYTMDITLDVTNHQYIGSQTIEYTNNSPDDLEKLYYHLYFNAFQPGSMMDVRSLTIADPDKRVGDRISKLDFEETGWVSVKSIKVNGTACDFEEDGTILIVYLEEAIPSGTKAKLEMEYKSQIPAQIRRSGRNNKEGIDYSMTQWYPKLCAYDKDGWHPNPYVGREFYGNWGNFDVSITLPGNYIIGSSGELLNPEEVGQEVNESQVTYATTKSNKTWKLRAKNVHDFAWAADPQYTHLRQLAGDVQMDYYFIASEKTQENWNALHSYMVPSIEFMNERYGTYPYPRYAIIQGGDGGMEYPMATLITGERSIGSLVGVSIHEWMHSWYQMVLATDEAQYPWMDEGFTSFGTSEVTNYLREIGMLEGEVQQNPIANSMIRYADFALSGYEEPLTTHADHYYTNSAYGVGSYVKGAVYLKQLEYIVGKEAFDNGLLAYFDKWKFKHPTAKDFLRIMEKEADMVLDWYHDYFVNTTKTIDYSIENLKKGDNKKETEVILQRNGQMPMPIDIQVETKDGEVLNYTIPLKLMRGEKRVLGQNHHEVLLDWQWTNPQYSFVIPHKLKKIQRIEIDPSLRLADVNLLNNVFPHLQPETEETKE